MYFAFERHVDEQNLAPTPTLTRTFSSVRCCCRRCRCFFPFSISSFFHHFHLPSSSGRERLKVSTRTQYLLPVYARRSVSNLLAFRHSPPPLLLLPMYTANVNAKERKKNGVGCAALRNVRAHKRHDRTRDVTRNENTFIISYVPPFATPLIAPHQLYTHSIRTCTIQILHFNLVALLLPRPLLRYNPLPSDMI